MRGVGQLSVHGSAVIGHTLCEGFTEELSQTSVGVLYPESSAFFDCSFCLFSGPQFPQGFFLLHWPSKHHYFLLWEDLLDVLVLCVHVVSLVTELRAL